MDVAIKPYDSARKQEVLDLVRLCLGNKPGLKRDAAWWDWRHEANPFGRSLILTAEVDGHIVGVRPLLRWRLRQGDRLLLAVKPIDTVTHPDFQRRGIFTRLTRAAMAQAENEGVELLFNTPNRSSLPGYLRMGWNRIARLPVYVKVLRPWATFGRSLRAVCRRGREAASEANDFTVDLPSAAEVLRNPENFAGSLSEGTHNGNLHTPRTPEFLQWRFAQHPYTKYYAAVEQNGAGSVGAAFVRTRMRGPFREVMLDDLFACDDRPDVAARLIEQICQNVQADYLVAHVPASPEHQREFRRLRFRKAPGQGIELVARSVCENGESFDVQSHPWTLTFGDIEGL